MPTNRQPLKCKGILKKYNTACPQKLFFFDASLVDIDQLLMALEIKCPRCGEVVGKAGD